MGSDEGRIDDDHTGERRYDSFIVRLWRAEGSVRLLRVEVEHAQSDAVASARGVEIDWIGVWIAQILGASQPPPMTKTFGDAIQIEREHG